MAPTDFNPLYIEVWLRYYYCPGYFDNFNPLYIEVQPIGGRPNSRDAHDNFNPLYIEVMTAVFGSPAIRVT